MRVDEVELDITTQGACEVDHSYMMASADNIVAFAIDMKTKRGEILATCAGSEGPGIIIGPNEDSLYLHPNKASDSLTEIHFPEYEDGWTVWASDYSRYTITVCLIKY